jgi:hypothetical protein
MDLIAYEAGQHLLDREGRRTAGVSDLMQRFIEANRRPRMGELYQLYYQTWFKNGGGVIATFASVGGPGRFGFWGMKEYLSQPLDEAPKFKATLEAISNPDLPVAD